MSQSERFSPVVKALSLARGAFWRARGRSAGWALVHPSVRFRSQNGVIRLGEETVLSRDVYVEAVSYSPENIVRLTIGDRTKIDVNTRVMAHHQIAIGSDCSIAWDCTILDSDLHELSWNGRDFEKNSAPILINDHVWIGCSATVLKGVTIGEGAVVAARSVVIHDVPPRTLVAGVPAKPVKDVRDWK